MTVGELAILLGIKLDRRSVSAAQSALGGLKGMALGLGAALGARSLGKAMIGFNSTVENAKLNMASMLALARKTGVSEQLTVAGEQYELIRQKASELPGTTEEYVSAMGRLIYPLSKAGFSLEKIRELSVNTVVAAKGIGITSVAASLRDVQQALEGRFSSTDLFLKSLLEPMGFEGEEGRARFKALSKERRAEVLNDALTQKAIVESAQLQAQTFTGQMDKVKEQTYQFLGRIGLPLFKALGAALKAANKWLEANKESVQAVADAISGAFLTAWEAFQAVVEWFVEHEDVTKAVFGGIAIALGAIALKATLAWMAVMGPFLLIVGMIAAGVYVFLKLRDVIGDVGAALAGAFATYGIYKLVDGIRSAVRWMTVLKAVSAGGLGGAGTSTAAGIAANAGGAATTAGGTAAAAGGAKAGKGGFLRSAAGLVLPVGLAMMAAEPVGNFLDDKLGKGGFTEALEANGLLPSEGGSTWWNDYLTKATTNRYQDGSGGNAPVTVNVAPANISINAGAADAEGVMKQFASVAEEQYAAALRAARAAGGGNR